VLDQLIGKRGPVGGHYPFALIPTAQRAGVSPHAALAELRALEFDKHLTVKLDDEAFVLRRSAPPPAAAPVLAAQVVAHLAAVEGERLYKLHALYALVRSFATASVADPPPPGTGGSTVAAR
jgi:hypothetical protein